MSTYKQFRMFSPHRLYGVFEASEDVREFRSHVGVLGVSEAHLSVLAGASGIVQLDASGKRGGWTLQFVRFTQGMTDELREISKYLLALQRGQWVVLVDMPRDDVSTKHSLRAAFQAAGALSVDYFGTLTNEELYP